MKDTLLLFTSNQVTLDEEILLLLKAVPYASYLIFHSCNVCLIFVFSVMRDTITPQCLFLTFRVESSLYVLYSLPDGKSSQLMLWLVLL